MGVMTTGRRPWLAVAVGALCVGALAGCGDDFELRSQVSDYRIIGIQAEPPEVGSEDTVTVTVQDLDPKGRAVTYRWEICLLDLGAPTDFACADPALRFDVTGDRAATVDLSAFNLKALVAAAGGRWPTLDGGSTDLSEGLDVRLVVSAGPPGGPTLRAVKRLRVRDGGTPNANPTGSLAVEATEIPGRYRLVVTPAPGAAETYTDDDTPRTEELVFSWYATAGEVDPPLTFGDTQEAELTLPMPHGPVAIRAAVRDGRGGLAVLEAALPATSEPAPASP